MSIDRFLLEAVAVLGTSVGIVFLCARLRIPSVIGLIVTGMLIGPFGLALVSEVKAVEIFAEIGVVLLLFIIGLELNVGQLRELRRPFLLGGGLQAFLTTAAAMALAMLWVPGPPAALFIGMVVALSSTAVVLKIYGERRELRAPHGRAVLGVLLFQDFLIVPFLVVAPMLAGRTEVSAPALALRFAGALGSITLVVLAAWWVMPRVLHQIVRVRVRELFVMFGLVSCLALAWLTHSLGLSMALGAFLAGILVSESEYSHQLIADMVPLRDVFASIFFVSIGMLVDLQFAADGLGRLLALAGLVIAIKIAAATFAIRATGFPWRVALLAGLGLAQLGEFSFLLLEVGRDHGLLSGDRFQTLLSLAVVTLLTTPLLIRGAPAIAEWIASVLGRSAAADPSLDGRHLEGHVIVVGMGEHGRLLGRVLGDAHVPMIAVDLDPDAVAAAREAGIAVQYGDATRLAILRHAGIQRAQVMVLATSDVRATLQTLQLAREENPDVALLVTTRSVQEIATLRQAGANDVVSEEYEAAIAVFSGVLEHYHVPANVIRAQRRVLRGEDYQLLRSSGSNREVSEQVLAALERGTADLYRIGERSRAVGCSLKNLELRSVTGASVIAIVRGEESLTNPSPDLDLEAGDQLVLVGNHAQVERAFEFLDDQQVEF